MSDKLSAPVESSPVTELDRFVWLKKRTSVKTGVLLLFGILLILLTLVLALVIERLAREQLLIERTATLRTLSVQIADKLNRSLIERHKDIKLAGSLIHASGSLFREAGTARLWLDNLQKEEPLYAWIGFADIEGKVVASTQGMLESESVLARPWFKEALKGTFIGDLHKAKLLEILLPSRDEPWRFIDIAIPIHDQDKDNQVIGVLGAHLSWTWAEEITLDVLKARVGNSPVDALILDKYGQVLLGPASLIGRQLASLPDSIDKSPNSESWPDGHYYLWRSEDVQRYSMLAGLGWKILVRQQETFLEHTISQLQERIFPWTALVSFCCLLIAYLLSGFVTYPMRNLALAVKQFARAKQKTDFQPGWYRESAELAFSLKNMVEEIVEHEQSLIDLNNSLEKRVLLRTKGLQDALKLLGDSERKMRTIANNLPVMIGYIDDKRRFQFENATFGKRLNLKLPDLIGRTPEEVLPEDWSKTLSNRLTKALEGEHQQFEIESGQEKVRCFHIELIPDLIEGVAAGCFLLVSDVTAYADHAKALEWKSRHDSLTGILNRAGIYHFIEQAISRSSRGKKGLAVLFLDLDYFKSINDTYGHDAGDQVIKHVADILYRLLRKTDGIGRLGGDEFVAVLESLSHARIDSETIARKIIDTLDTPILISADVSLKVTASIGIAYTELCEPNLRHEGILKTADEAMYEAKGKGRNGYFLLQQKLS